MKIAIIYHTAEGHTTEIARHIAERQRGAGYQVDVYRIEDAPDCLLGYAAAILGGSVHMGRHDRSLVSYAKQHAGDLSTSTSAFFSVSLSAAEGDDVNRAQADRCIHDFIEETGWHPDLTGVFGGALLYTRYGFIKRKLMQAISRRRGGPTDTTQDYDMTDWEAVEHFADDVVRLAEHQGESQPAWD